MDIIIDYLVNEKNITIDAAKELAEKVSKYDDIREEFALWINTRKYKSDNPLIVNNYSAADIFNLSPSLDGIGVFNFLVTLRDDPDLALKIISYGFMRR